MFIIKKRVFAFMLAVISAGCIFTSCGNSRLNGRYELCDASGMDTGASIDFKKDGTFSINNDKGKYIITDNGTIIIKDATDSSLSGEFEYKITDKGKKYIYIKNVSEDKFRKMLDNKAFLLYSAVNSAILDVSITNGAHYSGTYMVSSDGSADYSSDGEMPLDTEFVMEAAKVYLKDIPDMKYLIVIDNNTCISAACSMNGSFAAGCYPPDGIVDVKTRDLSYKFTADDRVTVDLVSQLYKKQLGL